MGKAIAKSLSVGMLILGAIIGAGFASGQELVSFFGLGTPPWIIATLAGVLIFLISALFLFLGSKINAKNVSEINTALVGKFHFVADAVLLVNSLIILSAMLGAVNSLGSSAISPTFSPLYAIVVGAIAVVVALKGAKGLIVANKIVSPLLIAALIFIALFTTLTISNREIATFRLGSIWTLIVYVCMNMMLASTVVTTLGKMDKKTIFLSSGVAAVCMGVLIFVLMTALNTWGDASAPMPILDMARHIHVSVYWIMVVVLFAGIFTTILTAMTGLVSWFEGIFGGKLFSACVVIAAGFILSNLGFSTVVRVLYPIIGILGVVYTLVASSFVVRQTKLANRLKEKSSLKRMNKSAKNSNSS